MSTIGTIAGSAALPVVRAAELDPGSAGRVPWLVDDLWAAAGVGVLGGAPKACKTWLGLELAVSVATGTDCLGRFPVRQPGPALLFLAEDALRVVKERLTALCRAHGQNIEGLDLFVITAPALRLDRHDDVARLDQAVAAIKPRLLLLDPFIRLHHADENNAQEMAAILDRLRLLQRTHDLAIVLVHHARKNGRAGPGGLALRGSSDLWAWGDSNLYVDRHKDRIRLSFEHRAAPAREPLHLALVSDPPHLAVVDAGEASPLPLERRILQLLDQGPLGRAELRQRLAINNARLGQALHDLERQRLVSSTDLGWAVAPAA